MKKRCKKKLIKLTPEVKNYIKQLVINTVIILK
jgi:hypothetical protein